ncbi:hypothetical protein [Pigmentiphaga daeguensis]|uniref:Uncharacterized protein n=1 Tax=Pigmentiphaga daeguensis TaxID=414049 RepID=A0ABN1D6S3_9BURK
MTKRRSYSVIDPNAKAAPAREPRLDARPLTYDRAMQHALDRARAAQPPMSPLAGKAGQPWNSSHDQ